MIKGVVRGRLQPFFEKNGYSQHATMSDWTLEAPRHAAFGHFATNIAFDLAKRLKRSPQQIASEMSDQLNADPQVLIWASAQAVSGFVNLTLSDAFICESFFTLVYHKPRFPRIDGKMLLEYVSANPTGPLHIGHGRWAVIGSVMANLLRYVGADLSTEFYINDAGSQVQKLYASVNAMRKDQPVPEDGYHGHYIRDLAQMSADPVAVILAGQRAVLDKLGVRFDNWFSEKSLYGDALVDRAIVALRKKELAYDLNGAVWFKSTSFGDEKDRVLVKSTGEYTYFAVDVAYHLSKIERGFDDLINIWGADHHGYVQRIRAAVMALGGDRFGADHGFQVILGQMVSLFRDGVPVRMSKRSGDMISLEDVVEEIGVDATRYFLAEKSPDTHLDFDLGLAVQKSNENPVFYIQYAHARMCSILEQAKPEGSASAWDLDPYERAVMLHALLMYDALFQAAVQKIPHRFVHYLATLAKLTHQFYENCPALKAEPDVKNRRLQLVLQLKVLLAECLGVLGISAPVRM